MKPQLRERFSTRMQWAKDWYELLWESRQVMLWILTDSKPRHGSIWPQSAVSDSHRCLPSAGLPLVLHQARFHRFQLWPQPVSSTTDTCWMRSSCGLCGYWRRCQIEYRCASRLFSLLPSWPRSSPLLSSCCGIHSQNAPSCCNCSTWCSSSSFSSSQSHWMPSHFRPASRDSPFSAQRASFVVVVVAFSPVVS